MGWGIIPTEKHFVEDIEKADALANGICRVLPLFMHPATVAKYGLEDCEVRVQQLSVALREFLCLESERWLAENKPGEAEQPE